MGKRQKPFKAGHGSHKKNWDRVESSDLTATQMAKQNPLRKYFRNLLPRSVGGAVRTRRRPKNWFRYGCPERCSKPTRPRGPVGNHGSMRTCAASTRSSDVLITSTQVTFPAARVPPAGPRSG